VIYRVHKSSIQRNWKSIPVQVPPVTTCLEDALVQVKHLPNEAIGPFKFQVFQILWNWLEPKSVEFQLLCQFLDLVVDVVVNLVVASPVINFLQCSIQEVLVTTELNFDRWKITPSRGSPVRCRLTASIPGILPVSTLVPSILSCGSLSLFLPKFLCHPSQSLLTGRFTPFIFLL
jgi:hypothetical protein